MEVSINRRLPVELAAQAALGVVSLVCQPFINVHCPPYAPGPVGLILVAVSNTSGGKTSAMQPFLKEIVTFERKQETEFEVAMADYCAELKLWEDNGRMLAKAYREAEPGSDSATALRAQRLQHERERPVKPKEWALRYGEISPQGLRDALVAYPAVGIWAPEAGAVFNGITLSQPDMVSGYWSGEDRPVGLVSGSRRPVDPCFSMTAMLQHERFVTYMQSRGATAFATGFLARGLFAFPKTSDCYGEPALTEDLPHPKLDRFNQQVATILRQSLPVPGARLNLQLSERAKSYWKLFKEAVHNQLICGNYSEAVKSFFRKIAQQATRLATLFHYFDGASGDVSPAAMKSAIALCEWYLWEWIREFTPYAPSQEQQDDQAAQTLLQWLRDVNAKPGRYQRLTPGRYTERELRNYSRVRGNPEALEKAIGMLQDQGYIAVQTGPKGGRVIFYPAQAAPIPIPLPRSVFDQPMPQHLNTSFNGVSVMAAQHPAFSIQQMPTLPTADSSSNLNHDPQVTPISEEDSFFSPHKTLWDLMPKKYKT